MRCFTAESFEQFIKVELKIDITPWQRDIIQTLDNHIQTFNDLDLGHNHHAIFVDGYDPDWRTLSASGVKQELEGQHSYPTWRHECRTGQIDLPGLQRKCPYCGRERPAIIDRNQHGIIGDAYHGVSEPIPLHNQPCNVAGCYGQDPNCQYRAGEQSKWAFDGGPPLSDAALGRWVHICKENKTVELENYFLRCPNCGTEPK